MRRCTFLYWWFCYACAVIHACVGCESPQSVTPVRRVLNDAGTAILILRVNAMYLCNKRLLVFLSTFFVCSLIGETVFITYMLTQMRSTSSSADTSTATEG